MSMGGQNETQQSMPPWLEEASQDAIAQAGDVASIGYVPYYGPDVAAFNPMQQAAMQNTANMAGDYGMAMPQVDIPAPQTFAGGVQGYSSAPLYEQSVATLQAERPGQYDAIMSQFIDPVTGQPYGGGADQGGQQPNPFGLQPAPYNGTVPGWPDVFIDPITGAQFYADGTPVYPGGRGS